MRWVEVVEAEVGAEMVLDAGVVVDRAGWVAPRLLDRVASVFAPTVGTK